MESALVLRNSHFMELTNDEMLAIDGGSKIIGGLTVIAGAAGVVGGIAMLAAPEPTGLTKVGGWAAVVGGVATIGAGIATMME